MEHGGEHRVERATPLWRCVHDGTGVCPAPWTTSTLLTGNISNIQHLRSSRETALTCQDVSTSACSLARGVDRDRDVVTKISMRGSGSVAHGASHLGRSGHLPGSRAGPRAGLRAAWARFAGGLRRPTGGLRAECGRAQGVAGRFGAAPGAFGLPADAWVRERRADHSKSFERRAHTHRGTSAQLTPPFP